MGGLGEVERLRLTMRGSEVESMMQLSATSDSGDADSNDGGDDESHFEDTEERSPERPMDAFGMDRCELSRVRDAFCRVE